MDHYAIYEALFEKGRAAEKALNDKFIASYDDLKALLAEMSAEKGFNGQTQEGFLEMFEILVRYHGDLNKELPTFYKQLQNFEDDLKTIPTSPIYKKLSEEE